MIKINVQELEELRRNFFLGELDISLEEYRAIMRQYHYMVSDPPEEVIELWRKSPNTKSEQRKREEEYSKFLKEREFDEKLAYYKANKDVHGKIDGVYVSFDGKPWL